MRQSRVDGWAVDGQSGGSGSLPRVSERAAPTTLGVSPGQTSTLSPPATDALRASCRHPLREAAAILREFNPPFAVDLILRTTADTRARLARHDPFISAILGSGVVLHEARNT